MGSCARWFPSSERPDRAAPTVTREEGGNEMWRSWMYCAARLACLMLGAVGVAIAPGTAAADSASCAFVAANELRIGNAASVAGEIGGNEAGGRVQLGRHVVLSDGTTVAGDVVAVSNASSLFDVDANVFAAGRGVTIRGTVGVPTLPLSMPFCSVSVLECGGPDVVVHRGDPPRDLAPGSYGGVTLANGPTLRLAPGGHGLCSLRRGL